VDGESDVITHNPEHVKPAPEMSATRNTD